MCSAVPFDKWDNPPGRFGLAIRRRFADTEGASNGRRTMKKLTVRDILNLKGKRALTEVLATDAATARACEAAGIDMLITSIGCLKEVRSGAWNTFITAGLPYGHYNASDAEAIKAAFGALNDGADAVYACMSMDRIRAMADEGIPVAGHVGLVPEHLTWIGGYRAVGKTAAEALQVYRDTLALQEAGAFAVEMEVVPDRIAAEITKRVELCVISMGSGHGCDAQYLFACDILGMHNARIPRHAKKYRNHHAEMQRLHEDAVQAFREFRQDVAGGAFPGEKNIVGIKDEEFEGFTSEVDEAGLR
jgi:3-methyl-2-oxobutanoate hydroxymethyltransferase